MTLRLHESEKPLSEKPHSIVLKGEFRTDIVAVKRLRYGELDVFEREIRQLQKLDHKNIVVFKAVFRNRDGSIDVVMQIAELENLTEAIAKYDHSIQWKYSVLYQISSGLTYLHANGIVHGRLVPENILFQDLLHSRALISNYCKAVRKYSRPKIPETLLFEAPERTSSEAADVYSMTLIHCCILAHKNPSNQDELDAIVEETMRRPEIVKLHPFSRILTAGLSNDPEERPEAAFFELTFDLGLSDYMYRISKDGGCTDECFRLFLMLLTCAIIVFISCDIQNWTKMRHIPESDFEYE